MDWVTRMLLDKWYDEFIKENDRFPTVAEFQAKIRELEGRN